jgi:hypothetical protein
VTRLISISQHFYKRNRGSSDVCCKKELAKLPLNVKLGIDVLKKINTSENSSLAQIIENNTDNDSSMCGGPVCRFNGVEVPCFVCCTKKASITSELLVEMLKTIDSYKLFDLSNGSLPFLVLDGHQSQTRLLN